jgi:hypothetical protein
MSSSLVVTSSANLTDTTGSLSVSWINATSGTNWRIQARILINGTQIASRDIAAIANSSTTVTYDANSVYTAAEGSSLSGAVVVQVVNYENIVGGLSYTRNSSAGNITINARLTSFSLTSPTTASPIDMDLADPVNVIGSWTRPHTAFRGRVRLYVGNSSGGASTTWNLVSNRFGFTTGVNYDVVALGLTEAIVSAMNNASPKDIKVEVQSQFRDGSASNFDLSGGLLSRTANSGVIRTFFIPSTVSSTVAINVDLNQTMDVTIVPSNSSYSHRAHFEFLNSSNVWTILASNNMASGATTTSFTLTQTMVNSIASNHPTSIELTNRIRIRLETFTGAGQTGDVTSSTKTGTAIITNCNPTWTSTTVYIENVGGIVRTLTGGTSFLTTLLQNKSTATVTYGGIQTLKYATPVSYAIGFGTPVVTASSGGSAGSNGTYTESGITQALTAAQLNYSTNQTVNITITDSRGLSATQQITFIILPYARPNLQSFEFYRNGGYSTDLRVNFVYDIQSIVIGGVERNTADNDDVQYRIGTGGTWTNINTVAGVTAGGRITYTRTAVALTTLPLGDTQTYFLRYRDDVETTHVTTSGFTVGKAIPVFQIKEDGAYVNDIKLATINDAIGAPDTITPTSTNTSSGSSHTHAINFGVVEESGYTTTPFISTYTTTNSETWWQKYSDGTLILHGRADCTIAITTSRGSGAYFSSSADGTMTIPATGVPQFIDRFDLHASTDNTSNLFTWYFGRIDSSSQGRFGFNATSSISSRVFQVHWTAIGRWKV